MPDDPTAPTGGASRRQFLVGAGVIAGGVAGGAVLASGSRPAAAAPPAGSDSVRVVRMADGAAGGWYAPNRAPLQPGPFQKLPPGSVTPKGWIRGQLDLQAEGLNGRMYEISDYLVYENCGWVDPVKTGWEELPYWLRGFSDLGLVTGNDRVHALAGKWIDGILATQQSDGWFGPTALRTSLEGGPDFWPSMPLLDLLRSHDEAVGDERIVPFLTSFFGFMNKQPDAVFGRSWAASRWGDDIDSILWLYNRTGDSWLLDLVTRIHDNSENYVGNVPNWHNVNLAQGFREPAEYGQVSGAAAMRQGTYDTYELVMSQYGQFAGGGFAGDENARSGFYDPRQGFETCGIVEMMRSCEMLTRITGDPVWADRCEELALNSLPAAFDPQQKGTHYVTSANSVALENVAKAPDFDDNFPLQAYRPGLHIYRCCPHNYGQGWPYYSEEMWVATSDGGLCASMYGPSEVTAKVGTAGTPVKLAQTTDYPFGETVTLRVDSAATVHFPLWLRVPSWCTGASVRVNGRRVDVRPAAGSYVVLERTWHRRDEVVLTLPMTTSLQTWSRNGDSASVRRGPLAYSLAIGEEYTTFTTGDDSIDDPAWPQYEVRPTSNWNVGLDVDPKHVERDISVRTRRGPVPDQPFTHDAVPIRLQAPVRQVAAWTVDDANVVRHLQPSPVLSPARPTTATLIPMGAARLRLTSFPLIAQRGKAGHEWENVSASHCFSGDLTDAVNDRLEPSSSYDQTMPRLTFWDHVGTTEWVQYDYAAPITVRSSAVYWYDDTGNGSCRVPASWQLVYLRDGVWTPVAGADAYCVAKDAWNKVAFDPVRTSAMRLVVVLAQDVSGGVLEWQVDQERS